MTALEAALSFALRGFAVLPVRRGTKRPLLRAWPDRASTEPSTIRSWFERYPSAGVGVLAGAKSGIAVLDVELENLEAFAQRTARLALPETLQVVSGGGGMHYYFRIEQEQRTRRLEGIGDLIGERSYVVAPPSKHGCGDSYEFRAGHSSDSELALLPQWLEAGDWSL